MENVYFLFIRRLLPCTWVVSLTLWCIKPIPCKHFILFKILPRGSLISLRFPLKNDTATFQQVFDGWHWFCRGGKHTNKPFSPQTLTLFHHIVNLHQPPQNNEIRWELRSEGLHPKRRWHLPNTQSPPWLNSCHSTLLLTEVSHGHFRGARGKSLHQSCRLKAEFFDCGDGLEKCYSYQLLVLPPNLTSELSF